MKENRTLISCYVQKGRGPTGGSITTNVDWWSCLVCLGYKARSLMAWVLAVMQLRTTLDLCSLVPTSRVLGLQVFAIRPCL